VSSPPSCGYVDRHRLWKKEQQVPEARMHERHVTTPSPSASSLAAPAAATAADAADSAAELRSTELDGSTPVPAVWAAHCRRCR